MNRKRMYQVPVSMAVIALLAGSIVGASTVYAEREGNKGDWGKKREERLNSMIEELQLTPEQAARIKELRSGERENHKASREVMKAKRDELRNALEQETIDRAKVNAIAAELKALNAQKIDARIEKVLATREILTLEQFKQLNQKMEQHRGKRGHGGKYRRGSQQGE